MAEEIQGDKVAGDKVIVGDIDTGHSLQDRAIKAICHGWYITLGIYAGMIFVPMLLGTIVDKHTYTAIMKGMYEPLKVGMGVVETLLTALSSSLMTAVTMRALAAK